MIIDFPARRIGRASVAGATVTEIWRGRLREWVGRQLARLRVPGAVADTEIRDAVTGQEIDIRVDLLFTKISINGRDYYFERVSGRFSGTGCGCG